MTVSVSLTIDDKDISPSTDYPAISATQISIFSRFVTLLPERTLLNNQCPCAGGGVAPGVGGDVIDGVDNEKSQAEI